MVSQLDRLPWRWPLFFLGRTNAKKTSDRLKNSEKALDEFSPKDVHTPAVFHVES